MDSIRLHDDSTWASTKSDDLDDTYLISQLIKIQEHQSDNDKSFQWYRDTTYLSIMRLADISNQDLVLMKQSDATDSIQSMLAVSYSWEDNQNGIPDTFTYRINEGDGQKWKPCQVRDSIVDRVLKYVRYTALPGFWVDKHCINQNDGPEKDVAIQSMDLVYRFGHQSIAFLTSAIHRTDHISLLSKLMSGKWIVDQRRLGRLKLRRYVRRWQAMKMIALLEYILSDRWWTRAWTYHEEFCASTKMSLMMPCPESVVRPPTYDFQDTPGEICLSAVLFREQLTRFCLAYARKQGERWQEGKKACEMLLSMAGQHKIINEYNKRNHTGHRTTALTWHVIRDLYHRDLRDKWEILGIIANCCGYSHRLDFKALRDQGNDLNAAVLTLVLLNGEILCNDTQETPQEKTQETTFFDLVDRLCLQSFGSVVDHKEYTYLKRCRFPSVKLTSHGIQTIGWIWKLERRLIIPAINNFKAVPIEFKSARLYECEIEQLNVLCKYIANKHGDLAAQIRDFLYRAREGSLDLYGEAMVVMAKNIVRHIQQGQSIAIGSLSASRKCHGIFAAAVASSHVFTAWQPRQFSETLRANRYLEKIVSLEIRLKAYAIGIPEITFSKWVAGLHFAEGFDQTQVLMPWAAPLHDIRSLSPVII